MKKNKLLAKFSLILGVTLISPNIVSATEISDYSNVLVDQCFNIDSDDVVVSDVMTYDELVNVVMENENLSKEEAQDFLGINDRITRASGQFYRTYGKRVTVNSNYKPVVQFYCKTSESGNFRGILEVLNTTLNRDYNGIIKQFSGSIYTNLEDPNTIYYHVNGDFFDKGTTSFSGQGGIKVNESFTVNFSISSSSNYYAYCNKQDRFKLNAR